MTHTPHDISGINARENSPYAVKNLGGRAVDKETLFAWLKIGILWLLSGWSWLVKALPVVALLLTVTFTALQIYILWRDKLRKRTLSTATTEKEPENGQK